MLCTSGFMDTVMSSHTGQNRRREKACIQSDLTGGCSEPGVEPDIYDSLVSHVHSPASFHIDLIHTDWLQTQRTWSYTSRIPVRAM